MRSEQAQQLSPADKNIVNADVAEQLRVMADKVESGQLDSVTDFWLVFRSEGQKGKVQLPVMHAGLGEATDLAGLVVQMQQRAVC